MKIIDSKQRVAAMWRECHPLDFSQSHTIRYDRIRYDRRV